MADTVLLDTVFIGTTPDLSFGDTITEDVLSVIQSEGFLDNDGQATSGGTAKIPNPLRDYNSYNYIITMGVLSANEANNPESIRESQFSQVILRSGGGAYDRRVQTSLELGDTNSEIPEQAFDDHAEYFIEDLEIDAVIAPNQNTRVALGTNVKFKVIEPYSMGKFIETLVIASQTVEFSNYTHTPYCLRIDFTGWLHTSFTNASFVTSPAFIPIQIVKMDFQVTDQGAVYEVEAVVYNDSALVDHVNQVKTPVNLYGRTVAELLADTQAEKVKSLTSILNDRIEDLENSEVIVGYDRYAILFPKDISEMTSTLYNLGEDNTITNDVDSDENKVSVDANVTLYDDILSIGSDLEQINEIGLSKIRADAESDQFTTSEINEFFVKYRIDISRDPSRKKFQFSQYDKITNIIEKIVVSSEYTDLENADDSGFVNYFRIQTNVLIDNRAEINAQIGRPRKIYVYMITPYRVHESKLNSSSKAPRGIDKVRSLALKEYNYYYTGLNEDVIDFKINFNNAYFTSVYSDIGRSPAKPGSFATSVGSGIAFLDMGVPGNGEIDGTAEPAQVVEHNDPTTSTAGGTKYGPSLGAKTRIAEMVFDRIVNSPVDMITAEIDIWGDPYFIPSDIGNYSPAESEDGLSVDGTMSYVNKEVYIIVNFNTPFDYQTNGNLMDMQGEYATFSGVYQVWGVTNMFSNGEFKQNLKLIRINKQREEETATQSFIIESVTSPQPFPTTTDQSQLTFDGIVSTVDTSGVNVGESTTTNTTSTTAGDDVVFGQPVVPTPTSNGADATRPPVTQEQINRSTDTFNQSLVNDIYENSSFTRAQPISGPQ